MMLEKAIEDGNANSFDLEAGRKPGIVTGEDGAVELGDCIDLQNCLFLDSLYHKEWAHIIY